MTWATLSAADAEALAEKHRTPFYFYDLQVLRERVERARSALPATLLYAVKANPHPRLVRDLRGRVGGLDVSSSGELELALRCGFTPSQLSFAGPGKTPEELAHAAALGVIVSVESIRELDALATMGKPVRVRLRLNPVQRAQAYRVPMIGGPSPFGIDEEELPLAVEHLRKHGSALEFEGVHVHPGGQCTSVGAFAAAAAATLELAERLPRDHGLPLKSVNFGGGFGVLGPEEELDVEAAGKRLGSMLEKFRAATKQNIEAVLDLGRWIAGPAGLYVARVVSEKQSRGKHFVILDGGLNHHLGATPHLAPRDAPRVRMLNLSRPGAPRVTRTIAGPLCTPLDTFGELQLPEPQVGDLLAVVNSGAYGFSFSPLQFLSHPLPEEVFR